MRAFLLRVSVGLGGCALLAAVAIDFTSVVARHIGLHVSGAIELIQFCIVAAISAALLVATLEGAHASVQLLTSRAPEAWRRRLEWLSDGLSFLALSALLVADAWVAADLWPQDERSDLLGLPFAPARVLWCAALGLSALFSLAIWRREPAPPESSDV